MQNTIRKIFSGQIDEEVHSEFVKFGKGVFENKYLIEAKKRKDKWSIKTGAEFANYLVRKCLEGISGKVKATGVIVSTFNIRDGMGGFVFSPEEEVKQFMGIKQLKVDSEIEVQRIMEVMNKFPRAFFALSFAHYGNELKIKPKAPKSAKPPTKSESEPKINFCSLKTDNKEIIDDLFFDYPDFNEILIKHTLKIDEIILPKNEKEPIKMRELSKRKGIVKRIVKVDGSEKVSEKGFEA